MRMRERMRKRKIMRKREKSTERLRSCDQNRAPPAQCHHQVQLDVRAASCTNKLGIAFDHVVVVSACPRGEYNGAIGGGRPAKNSAYMNSDKRNSTTGTYDRSNNWVQSKKRFPKKSGTWPGANLQPHSSTCRWLEATLLNAEETTRTEHSSPSSRATSTSIWRHFVREQRTHGHLPS